MTTLESRWLNEAALLGIVPTDLASALKDPDSLRSICSSARVEVNTRVENPVMTAAMIAQVRMGDFLS